MPTKEIIIANHIPIVSLGIEGILKEIPESDFLIRKAKSYQDLKNKLQLYSPEILIFNVELTGAKEIDTIREIKELNSHLKIFAITLKRDGQKAVDAIKAKASAILPLNFEIEEFREAFNRVSNGGIYLCDLLKESLND